MHEQLVLLEVGHMVHEASTIRWRPRMYTGHRDYHEFKVGDQVVIARTSPHILTDPSIIGHIGVITEVDEMSMSSVEVDCVTCNGVHTMHEDELDFMGDAHMNALREKAGMPGLRDEPVSEETKLRQAREDRLAVAMHNAGFIMPAVEARNIPMADPMLWRPKWSCYLYGKIWRLATFGQFHARLINVARSEDAVLSEWCCYSVERGWVPLLEDDMDVMTLEMPIRVTIQSRASNEDVAYDEAKYSAINWLQSPEQIDIGAIARALREKRWKFSNWSNDSTGYSFNVEIPAKTTVEAVELFTEWALEHWVWEAKAQVCVSTESDRGGARYVQVCWHEAKLVVLDLLARSISNLAMLRARAVFI